MMNSELACSERKYLIHCWKVLKITCSLSCIASLSKQRVVKSNILGSYAKATGCNVSEAEFDDLTQYSNLGNFFKRKLKVSF